MAFVRWAPHVEIMRRYRERGRVVASTWEAGRFDPGETWARARGLVGE
jgi:hypothetical protein